MKHRILLFYLFFAGAIPGALACDVCKQNQPKVLQNITHGPGPSGTIDYAITWGAVVIVLITLWFSIKFLVKPREKDPGHIKHMILPQNSDAYGSK
jgi:hypothetical protein